MSDSNRRDFIRKSILGVTGAALLQGTSEGDSVSSSLKAGQDTKIYDLPSRELGKTGISTPLISFGAAGVYDPNFVRAVYDSGVKLFFSATYYGEGNNEKVVGEGLRGLPRESFFLGTAVPADGYDSRQGVFTSGFSEEAYIKKAEASLARFGLDQVDVFLFPYAGKRTSVMHEPMMNALRKLREQGKTRYLGIATHNDCEEALRTAADSGFYDIVMTSYNYRIQNIDTMNDALAYAVASGLGILAIKTTAGAARDKNATKPLNNVAALKWVLQNKNISSIVSGMTTIDQLQKNLAMIKDLTMTQDELNNLDLAVSDIEPGLYCHQCRKCVPQCPHNIEIPSAMRSYMYAYGYRNTRLAKASLEDSGIDSKYCNNCRECIVRCSAGFDVRDKIRDISRLLNVPDEFLIS
jgi:predicted aldo/keto reductase-like oxidoreductase